MTDSTGSASESPAVASLDDMAFATMVFGGDTYVGAAMVLAHSLKKHGPPFPHLPPSWILLAFFWTHFRGMICAAAGCDLETPGRM